MIADDDKNASLLLHHKLFTTSVFIISSIYRCKSYMLRYLGYQLKLTSRIFLNLGVKS